MPGSCGARAIERASRLRDSPMIHTWGYDQNHQSMNSMQQRLKKLQFVNSLLDLMMTLNRTESI